MTGPPHGRDVDQLIRGVDAVEPTGPVDLAQLGRAGRNRSRTRIAVSVAATAVALVVAGLAAASYLSGPQRMPPQPTGSGDDGVVPWKDTTAPAPPADPADCEGRDLRVGLGRTGAWHAESIQDVDVTNLSAQPCTFSAGMFSATVTAPTGRTVAVEDPASVPTPVVVGGNQTVHVAVGAPASCRNAAEIARLITVRVAGRAAQTLDNAWVPVNCGSPSVGQVNVDPTEPGTESVPVSALVHAPQVTQAGTTLHFTVELTNTSTEPITFAECPSYMVGLKVAQVGHSYQLNCEASPILDPGGSRTYAMQVDVPDTASGNDSLTWSLRGYPAAGTVQLQVN